MTPRRWAFAVLAAAIAAAPAAAHALPAGSPKSLRQARPADALPRGAEMERWSIDFVNPRTRAHFNVTMFQRGELSGRSAYGEVFDSIWLPVRRTELTLTVEPATGDRLEWRGNELVALTRVRNRWRLRIEADQVRADIALSRVRAGITAAHWRLPPWYKRRAGTLWWSLPVATSSASGRVQLETHARHLKGWRASVEHAWGFQPLWPDNYDNWETAVVHTRGGGAWVLQGVNRSDHLTGPGARDAFWLGVLGQVDRDGVRICRPRLHRQAWRDRLGRRTRETRRTRCRSTATTFRNPLDWSFRGEYGDHSVVTYPATTRTGGAGWVRWIGNGLQFGGIPR